MQISMMKMTLMGFIYMTLQEKSLKSHINFQRISHLKELYTIKKLQADVNLNLTSTSM